MILRDRDIQVGMVASSVVQMDAFCDYFQNSPSCVPTLGLRNVNVATSYKTSESARTCVPREKVSQYRLTPKSMALGTIVAVGDCWT